MKGHGRRRARDRDHESRAFDEFVARSVRSLTRAAVVITWSLPDAEDAVQEALVRTARHWARVSSMAHPYGYARRIVVHQALRGAQKRNTQRTELTEFPDGTVVTRAMVEDDVFGGVDLRLELAQLLGTLAPRQRTVVVLRYAEQMTEAEVADLLGCPVGTVKSTAARALERLRAAHGPRRDASAPAQEAAERSPSQDDPPPSDGDRQTATDARRGP